MQNNNYYNARKYFLEHDERCRVGESSGITWVMHHIDSSWQYEDPDRYNQWNIEDLLPMTRAAHNCIHQTGTHRSEESRKKMSENHVDVSGENNPMYGVHRFGNDNPFYGRHHTDEAKKKMREHRTYLYGEDNPNYGKHHSEETRKKMSENHADYTGKNNPRYGKHLSEEAKKKISDCNKGKHWYNNGTDCITAFECPEGFVPGRLKKKGSGNR